MDKAPMKANYNTYTSEPDVDYVAVVCDVCGGFKPVFMVLGGYWKRKDSSKITRYACRSCITGGKSWYDYYSGK